MAVSRQLRSKADSAHTEARRHKENQSAERERPIQEQPLHSAPQTSLPGLPAPRSARQAGPLSRGREGEEKVRSEREASTQRRKAREDEQTRKRRKGKNTVAKVEKLREIDGSDRGPQTGTNRSLASRPRNSFTKSFDFLQDRFCGGGPDERLRLLVEVVGEGFYSVDEFSDGPEGAAPDGLLSDDIEPDFDLVEPGGVDRGKVNQVVLGTKHQMADIVNFVYN